MHVVHYYARIGLLKLANRTVQEKSTEMVCDPVCGLGPEPRKATAACEHQGRFYYFHSEDCRVNFLQQPAVFTDKAPGMRFSVGVTSLAEVGLSSNIGEKAYPFGRVIAQRGLILIIGACPGLPYECVRGATRVSGLSIGISPALWSLRKVRVLTDLLNR